MRGGNVGFQSFFRGLLRRCLRFGAFFIGRRSRFWLGSTNRNRVALGGFRIVRATFVVAFFRTLVVAATTLKGRAERRSSCRDGKSLRPNVSSTGRRGKALSRNIAGMRLTLGDDFSFWRGKGRSRRRLRRFVGAVGSACLGRFGCASRI